jgi:hypothetical protein
MTNCPNCGAPITSYKCSYCDTVFYNDLDKRTVELRQFIELEKQRLSLEHLYSEAIKAMRSYTVSY